MSFIHKFNKFELSDMETIEAALHRSSTTKERQITCRSSSRSVEVGYSLTIVVKNVFFSFFIFVQKTSFFRFLFFVTFFPFFPFFIFLCNFIYLFIYDLLLFFSFYFCLISLTFSPSFQGFI